MGQEDDLGKKRREKESNSNAMEPPPGAGVRGGEAVSGGRTAWTRQHIIQAADTESIRPSSTSPPIQSITQKRSMR